ncbi:MAG: glycine cleavage system protein GcvH [Anaerolineales bacterium]
MNTPQDLRYTKNDEWVRVEGDSGTSGITDYAQSQLSDIVFLEITAAVGAALKQGEAYAAVESVKAASDVYMPVAGTVTATNEALSKSPELINKDSYGQAWMIRFRLSDPAQLDGLMDAAAYQAYCQERSH